MAALRIGRCLTALTAAVCSAPVISQAAEPVAAAAGGPVDQGHTDVAREALRLRGAATGDAPETTGFVPRQQSSDTGMDNPDIPKIPESALKRYAQILRRGEFVSQGERLLVQRVIHSKLSLMTRKENQERVSELRQEVERDLADAGKTTGNRGVRMFILERIVDEAPKLLESNAVAGINGTLLLGALNEEEAIEGQPARPYSGAAGPLLTIVNDSQQPVSIRLNGVNGLARLGAVAKFDPRLRTQIVTTLVAQLNASGDQHEWFQWRLAEALGKLDLTHDEKEWLAAVRALEHVLTDPKRTWIVRSHAAQSLGRIPFERDFDIGRLTNEIADLTEQMTDAYEKEPSRKWQHCFLAIYAAFKPLVTEDGLLAQVSSKPALAKYKPAVDAAFERVLPLVKKVLQAQTADNGHAAERIDDHARPRAQRAR